MTKRRVVVTGIGLVTPLGSSFADFMTNLYAGRSGVRQMKEWAEWQGMGAGVAATVENFDGQVIARQQRRSMSRLSQFANIATRDAIRSSDLKDSDIKNIRTGIAYGSLMGGMSTIEQYFRTVATTNSFAQGMQSTSFLQMMSHTAAANIAMAFGIPGRLISSCVACSASTQSIGFGYELIRDGVMERMVCGGAEELHLGIVGCFDVLRATSRAYNDRPEMASRPFSADRDGLVCGEGAGTLILEDYEAALSRGAKIYGEIIGFFTCTDTQHMTNPSKEAMVTVMREALNAAGRSAKDVSYVNAHATGTDVGDVVESQAICEVLGANVEVSSLKGYFGHLMGACGVVETIGCLGMLEAKAVVPNRNLKRVDPRCAPIAYTTEKKQLPPGVILKNSFAFGGINASLVIAPYNLDGKEGL